MTCGRGSRRKLGYQAHYVVDGGKTRVVLDALVAPAEVTENRPVLDLLWHTCFRWKIRPHHVTADGKYGTLENIAALEEAGVRAYVALHESGSKPGSFPKGDFRYDPARDVYSCPAGKLLRPLGKKTEVEDRRAGKVTFYRARASECAVCQLRSRCTSNKNGRQLRRDPKERYAERVRAYRGTALYEKALRKRKVWVEPLFAEAKDWHGMRRFRLRRLEKVNIEALLIASGQNAKRLLDFGDWRPKKLAQAAALLLPVAAGHESSRAREHRSSCSWRPTKAFFNSLVRFRYSDLGYASAFSVHRARAA
jgi:hypothetical protein